MKGILEEAFEIAEDIEKGLVLDAGLVSVALRANHYEIASYLAARYFAVFLGHLEIVGLLGETLNEGTEASASLKELFTRSRVDVIKDPKPPVELR